MPARLRILSPGPGAHTGRQVTIRVQLSGLALGAKSLEYDVDHRELTRGGGAFVFRDLDPGRHRVTVTLIDDAHVHASSVFVVLAPVAHHAPVHAVAPVSRPEPESTTTAVSPPPARPVPPPPTTSAPPPPRTTTAAPPTKTAPPPSSGGIPQHNGGDGDADNNGGPSDGDGDI